MLPETMAPQNDFSAGELNADAKRSDDPLVRTGVRQAINWRIINSRKATNRQGRTALFPTEGRVDEVLVAPGQIYRLCFGNGTLKIRDASGNYVAGATGYSWTPTNAKSVVWALVNRSATTRDVIMTFPGQRPKVARWTSGGTWTFFDFAFEVNSYGAVQEPFYRIAPIGISITPSAVTGTITVTCSDSYFTASMVGTIIRWIEHQILITSFTDAKTVTGIVIETLPATIDLGTITNVKGTFNVGDAISSTTPASSGFEGEVAAVTYSGSTPTAIKINMFVGGQQFSTGDAIVGPLGTCTAGTVAVVSPLASTQWDEEVFNANRGWPQSCFNDQSRLGFCDIPAVPGGVAYSAIGGYTDFMVGANPSDPFFEIAPDRARVYHVISKGDEFFLTDQGIYYCPISVNNPLKPGSLQFLKFSNDRSSSIKPVQTSQAIVFVNAGLNRVVAIVVNTHSLYVPWQTIETSLYHTHLFNSPIALSVTNDGSQVPEQYVYVLNGDGTMAIGRFDIAKEWAGWVPWNGQGNIGWITSLGQNLVLTTTYPPNSTMIAEQLDETQYVDGAVTLNAVTTNMKAGSDPKIQTLLSGTAQTNLTDHALAATAFDGNFLKNKAQSVGKDSPTVGYGNRVYLNIGAPQKLARMRITAPLDAPLSAAGSTTFEIVGSNDGATWNVVYTSGATPGTSNEQIDVTSGIDQTNAYAYWGVDISGSSGKAISVMQVELFYMAPGTVHQSPSGGTGPLWWLAGGSADLIDGVRPLGTHQVDASGNVVLLDPAEDLSSATIMAGLSWQSTLEPFVQHAPGGKNEGQRVKRQKLKRIAVSVQNSTGFVMQGINVKCTRRIPPWNVGEDQNLAPPLREGTYSFRTQGRDYDPRVALVKDVPGPITIIEWGVEATA